MVTYFLPALVWKRTVPSERAKSVSSFPFPTFTPGWILVPLCRTMILPAETTCPSPRLTPSLLLMLSLPFILKTEGSLKSQTQLTLFYALVLGLTLLSVLAIFVSAASICSEVEQKHIQVTDTKPLKPMPPPMPAPLVALKA